MKKAFLLLSLFAAQAFAAEPAYWMKQYPNASQAKVDKCLAVAEQAKVEAQVSAYGVMGFTVLIKGNAWEACMDK